jgi:hypothetical protein
MSGVEAAALTIASLLVFVWRLRREFRKVEAYDSSSR